MTTVRTIKLKRASADSDSAPAGAVQAADPRADVAPQANAGPAIPAAAAKGASGKSYMPYMIAAVLVVIIFLAIMGLQYSEFSFYQAEPSVWVRK